MKAKDSPSSTDEAILIGAGRSGQRFFEASKLVSKSISDFRIVGVCDLSKERLAPFVAQDIYATTDLSELLQRVCVPTAIIATNDGMHEGIFRTLVRENYTPQRIICEKPLISDLSEIDFLRTNFGDEQICVNFVERYSKALSALLQHMQEHDLRASRIDFVWSKNRIRDRRPTIGIMSEITHPLDIACFVAGATSQDSFSIIGSAAIYSAFTIDESPKPEQLQVALEIKGVVVTGTSSYIRAERERRVDVFLSDKTGTTTQMATIRFDNPVWDEDQLFIYDVLDDARLSLVKDRAFHQTSATPAISKIVAFLEDSLGAKRDRIVGRDHALFVQEIVESALSVASRSDSRVGWSRRLETGG